MLLLLKIVAFVIVPLAPATPPAAPSTVASGRAVPAKAEGSLGSYLRDDDYPAAAIRNEEQGTVAFRLDVSAAGSVTGCTVTTTSGSALLDATTCRLMMERPRFTPARDNEGRSVADTAVGRIRWALPPKPAKAMPDNSAQRAIDNIWEVTAGGKERSCRRELRFEGGARINIPSCLALD